MSEITEFGWYLCDHLFRQSNQGKQKFQKQEIAKEMSNLYLRYKNSDLDKLNKLINILVEGLISQQVLEQVTRDGSLQLTSGLLGYDVLNAIIYLT